jgi:hypothetical protein
MSQTKVAFLIIQTEEDLQNTKQEVPLLQNSSNIA